MWKRRGAVSAEPERRSRRPSNHTHDVDSGQIGQRAATTKEFLVSGVGGICLVVGRLGGSGSMRSQYRSTSPFARSENSSCPAAAARRAGAFALPRAFTQEPAHPTRMWQSPAIFFGRGDATCVARGGRGEGRRPGDLRATESAGVGCSLLHERGATAPARLIIGPFG